MLQFNIIYVINLVSQVLLLVLEDIMDFYSNPEMLISLISIPASCWIPGRECGCPESRFFTSIMNKMTSDNTIFRVENCKEKHFTACRDKIIYANYNPPPPSS
jgi:hypothetical protein